MEKVSSKARCSSQERTVSNGPASARDKAGRGTGTENIAHLQKHAVTIPNGNPCVEWCTFGHAVCKKFAA